jgi:hypothetical protein
MLPAMVTRWPIEGCRDSWADEGRWVTLDPGKRWLVAGSPPLVLVAIAASREVTIALPVVSWPSPHRTSLGAESEVIFAPDRDEALADRLAPAIERVIATRLASFTPCAECQSVNPPEWMHDRRICQGCAERNHGVVH